MNEITTDFDLNCRAYPCLATFLMALGGIAHKSVLRMLDLKQNQHPFGHGTEYHLERDLILVSSYHCSRYDTPTKRLTSKMFENIFKQIDGLLGR